MFYEGAVRLPEGVAPDVKNKSHSVAADVTIPKRLARGVILAIGGEMGGYSFYIKGKKLHYTHNFLGTHYDVVSKNDVPTGDVTLGFNLDYSGNYGDGRGCGATVTLLVNDEPMAANTNIIERTVPARYFLETQDVGMDLLSPVTHNYKSPFEFRGTIKQVEINIEPEDTDEPSLDECPSLSPTLR